MLGLDRFGKVWLGLDRFDFWIGLIFGYVLFLDRFDFWIGLNRFG
jgi:hypothetical protein